LAIYAYDAVHGALNPRHTAYYGDGMQCVYPSFDFVRALRSVHESGLPPDHIALILGGNAKQLVPSIRFEAVIVHGTRRRRGKARWCEA
jgi:hypothetical protein